ncbi:MAG: indolepyruvate ferredoxin oxidoreductase subunit alpha [Planctomycetes bacterium]|nr:indolepyruvate ferredoxin oxidoreductase subunit alpha [Planctomycetota bacterium]
MAERQLMMGNEAVARGAWEAGVKVSTSYPGTPATEITEYMSAYPEVNVEWSVNEKVALEVAIGSAFAGARTIASMKQVGVNVAADPLFSLVYSGINAGLVIITADEPGLHSSQNEQDNRYYAKFAQVPMLEPSDAQEALDMVREAFEISEGYDTPVFVRMTTRVCHTACVVEVGERAETPRRPYRKNSDKYTMVPSHAYTRHFEVEKRQTRLEALSNTSELNRIEMRSLEYGVITSGLSYQNVREALPEFSVLKIGLTYPVPRQIIRNFASQVRYLYVVEENRPFLEDEILALGIPVECKELLLRFGELPAEALRRRILHVKSPQKGPADDVPKRPPQFCPGCGHRGIFHLLAKHKLIVNGDIGCYGLAALPPYNAMDTLICMGASIGMDHGFRKVIQPPEKSVAVIGDSTFFHSGMTNLANLVCNGGNSTVIILDNRITAMTGHQPSPATGKDAGGTNAPRLDIAQVARALGVSRVFEIDGYDLDALEKCLREEVDRPEPSVLVVKERCVMVDKTRRGVPLAVGKKCKSCRACLKLGCPALTVEGDRIMILEYLCDGCGICAKVCPIGAIRPGGAEND